MGQFRPDEALKSIWKIIAVLDKDIGDDKPWQLEPDKLKVKLQSYVERIQSIASDLEPFLPKTSEMISKIYNQTKISKPESIFPRKL
jgi:methionyl-tRNA synthetase